MPTKSFLVRKNRLREHQMHSAPSGELPPSALELRIERFGLTANNVTYGVLGDALSYWKFFPAHDPEWGILPAWGFGTVTRGAVAGIAHGDKFYGYFPMASHLVVEPKRVTADAFNDGAAHRQALPPLYNQYLRSTRDPTYRADTEPLQVVLRPLFATALFLADFLQESAFFGAEQVLVSSASSKLGCGTAVALREYTKRSVIGLTSEANVAFVESTGLYDRVLRYEDVALLDPARRAVLIDIAGSAVVRGAVHRHFGGALAYSSKIGATHWEGLARAEELPGPPPVTFFAPDWIKRRASEWGGAEVQKRLATGWALFIAQTTAWLTVVEANGEDAVARAYDDLIAGRVPPRDGLVLSLNGGSR